MDTKASNKRFLYSILKKKHVEGTIIKLRPIFYNNYMRNSKSTYNVFPNELYYVFVFDTSIGLSLYPLAEVVCGYEQEFFFLSYAS